MQKKGGTKKIKSKQLDRQNANNVIEQSSPDTLIYERFNPFKKLKKITTKK